MTTLEFTYDLEASATASASEVMTNLEDVATALDTISGSAIDPEDPVPQSGIAARYTLEHIPITVIPYGSDASWSSTGGGAAVYTIEGTLTRLAGVKLRTGSGQKMSLVSVLYRVAATSPVVSDDPICEFRKNGSVVIGSQQTLDTAGSWIAIERATPVANPIMQLADGDTLDVYVGVENGTDDASLRGFEVIFVVKRETTT